MLRKVTIIMYHYVRDVQGSRFPGLKALSTKQFRAQLDHLQQHYQPIRMEQVLEALDTGAPLPPKAALLTFDDGYQEHYSHVFPVLAERNLQGSFFPPAQAITGHTVLDVNKIHFLLAASPDINQLLKEVYSGLDRYRPDFNLPQNEHYFRKLAVANRFDPKEVIFIKRLFQHELPEPVRSTLLNHLFEQVINTSESAFSKELYMSVDQLAEMRKSGMHIGSHGYGHRWLGQLPQHEQEEEIRKGKEFLAQIGTPGKDWTLSYPYGSYNQSLLDVLEQSGCRLALTTAVAVADLQHHNRFEMPRLDTNDLLPDRGKPNMWWEIG